MNGDKFTGTLIVAVMIIFGYIIFAIFYPENEVPELLKYLVTLAAGYLFTSVGAVNLARSMTAS